MAVRFLPAPEARTLGHASAPERTDLAEVIDLRSRLARPATEPVEEPVEEPSAGARAAHDVSQLRRLRAAIEEVEGAGAEAAPACPPRPAGTKPRRARSGSTAGDLEAAQSMQAAQSARSRVSSEPPEPSPPRTAAEDGIRLLARRALSSDELRRELTRLGHDPHDADAAVFEFESNLYLDDLGLARVLAEELRERKRASRAQIRRKLRERLLPDGVAEQVLGEFDDDEEFELLSAAAADRARRLTGLDRPTAERRLLGFLARRGWSGESAVRAARAALDAQGSGTVRFR